MSVLRWETSHERIWNYEQVVTMMFEFATRWLVCLVLLAVVVQSERTIKNTVDNLFEERQAMLVWLFINVCLAVCTAVVMGWK